MRFLHHDIAELAEFLADNRYDLYDVGIHGDDARACKPEELSAYLASTQTLWGEPARRYILATATAGHKPLPLRRELDWIEETGQKDFVIVGYADGGVLTISQQKLPFQDGAREASWWTVS